MRGSQVMRHKARAILKCEKISGTQWRVWGGENEHVVTVDPANNFENCDCWAFQNHGLCSHVVKIEMDLFPEIYLNQFGGTYAPSYRAVKRRLRSAKIPRELDQYNQALATAIGKRKYVTEVSEIVAAHVYRYLKGGAMSWIKLDDQWMDHPKIITAGRDARDMWLASITWCGKHLTDGYFPSNLLPSLAVSAGVDVANCQVFARTLVDVCLWEETENGYFIHDYLEYNPSREQALATKEARKEAGRAGGIAKASKSPSKPLAKEKQNPAPSPSPSPNQDNLNNIDDAAKPARHSRKKPTPEETALNAKAKSLIDEFIELSSLKPVSPADWGKWQKMAKYLVGYHVEPPDLRAAYYHERQYGKNPISWIGSIKARAISQHREQ